MRLNKLIWNANSLLLISVLVLVFIGGSQTAQAKDTPDYFSTQAVMNILEIRKSLSGRADSTKQVADLEVVVEVTGISTESEAAAAFRAEIEYLRRNSKRLPLFVKNPAEKFAQHFDISGKIDREIKITGKIVISGSSEGNSDYKAFLDEVFKVALSGPDKSGVLAARMQASDEQIRAWFQQIDNKSPRDLTAFSNSQQEQLFRLAMNHKVAGLDHLESYDPQGIIGFCFGRAMAVQLIARRMGLSPESIKKLFIVGDLRSGADPEWRFHVTSLVLGDDGQWYAIDPIFDNPMTAREWIRSTQRMWDKGKKANFYITPSSAILPDMRRIPPANEEKGENIIEITFNPRNKAGLDPRLNLGKSVFEACVETARKYFSDVSEDEKDRFNFVSIKIENEEIGYNNYFSDLIQDLVQSPENIYRLQAGVYAIAPRNVATRKFSHTDQGKKRNAVSFNFPKIRNRN